jgi:hypothetical protein
MSGFSGWGTAGMFAMIVGILVVVAVAVTAVVLLVRPVFDGNAHSGARFKGERGRDGGATPPTQPPSTLGDRRGPDDFEGNDSFESGARQRG